MRCWFVSAGARVCCAVLAQGSNAAGSLVAGPSGDGMVCQGLVLITKVVYICKEGNGREAGKRLVAGCVWGSRIVGEGSFREGRRVKLCWTQN